MSHTPALLLKDVALSHPGSARILEAYHLDYCCGGKQTLDAACEAAGLDFREVLAALEQVQSSPAADAPIQEGSLAEIIGYIVDTHHAFTRTELTRIDTLLDRVIKRHATAHPELGELGRCFDRVRDDLLPHMRKEEEILFPYVRALETHALEGAGLPDACFASVEAPIAVMNEEHRVVGDLLKQMRKLSRDYAPPGDACATFRALYQALENLESDLMRHIHLENNVLFPRAINLAGSI